MKEMQNCDRTSLNDRQLQPSTYTYIYAYTLTKLT